jgi:hypothetical protein
MRLILDLCGGTGAWSAPYREAGYDVRIIDPLADGRDVRLMERCGDRVHGILAAPPCTHLSGSGARWWEAKGSVALLEALSVADACLRVVMVHKPVWWVLENPVGRLSRYFGKPRATFDPCDYGDGYTKKTCLWGEFVMPPKAPVPITHPKGSSPIHRAAPGPDRWRFRSATPPGFARAFKEANP